MAAKRYLNLRGMFLLKSNEGFFDVDEQFSVTKEPFFLPILKGRFNFTSSGILQHHCLKNIFQYCTTESFTQIVTSRVHM
jgi:hypothetical protein